MKGYGIPRKQKIPLTFLIISRRYKHRNQQYSLTGRFKKGKIYFADVTSLVV
jgi:hypothetical protein